MITITVGTGEASSLCPLSKKAKRGRFAYPAFGGDLF